MTWIPPTTRKGVARYIIEAKSMHDSHKTESEVVSQPWVRHVGINHGV